MVALSAETLRRLRQSNPHFDDDHALLEIAVRDCALAYYWNPIVSAREFAYLGWSTTLYAGIDDASRTAFVIFRGTDQPLDWVINLAFLPLPLAHPLAHGGIVAAWKLAKRRFAPWLRAEVGRFDRVVVSGHSLGGGLALACAYDLQREGFHIERCVTVGAPRVYTFLSADKVATKLGNRIIRVVRQQDLVPQVPPAWLGFRHVGTEWNYVGELMGEREAEPFARVSEWLDRIWYWFSGGPVGTWLKHQFPGANIEVHLPTIAFGALAGLGGAVAVLVQASVTTLLAGTLVFVVLSGALVALKAHRSGRYAATRNAASMMEEWQARHLRQMGTRATRAPSADGMVAVDLTLTLRADHTDACKRRLVASFRRFFGESTFQTAVGVALGQGSLEVLRGDKPDAKGTAEVEFNRVCVALLLYGYSEAEIDKMIDDGTITRPAGWTRYYATGRAMAKQR
ncbi:MAG: lipase family protein [Vicinamibacterales bacterium]